MKQVIAILIVFITINSSTNAQFWKKDKEKTSDSTKVEDTGSTEGAKKPGIFQKVVGKIAKVAGGAVAGATGMVATTNSLEEVDIIASVGTNIYPKSLGLMFNDFLGGSWVDYGDFCMLMLASKDGYKFYKYGGSIKVGDQSMKHVSLGIHTSIEEPKTGNKKIVFEKNGSVEGSFEVERASKNIKLVSINGQKENVKLDLTKDVVLEFENYRNDPDALLRIDLVYTVIGIRTLGLVCYVKPADKVIIPAEAFRNIETENKGISFNNTYLAISEQWLTKSINNTGAIKDPLNVITGSNDGKWVTITNKNDQLYGIKFNSSNTLSGKTVDVNVLKKNAAYAMPISFAKKVAVATMSMQGTTYLYETTTNRWQQTETTKEIKFPQLPDSWLDETLHDLYNRIVSTYTEVAGGEVLPAEAITNCASYNDAQRFFKDEMNSADQFLRSYKGLTPVKNLSSQSMKINGENALLKDANADALLKVNFALQLSTDKKAMMTPYLSIEMDGASNGGFRSFVGNTKYFSILLKGEPLIIKSGKHDFTKNDYYGLIQLDAFQEAFKKALTELKSKEQEYGDYEKIWRIQK